MALDKYRRMRDFGDTPEPKGSARPRKGKKPIFVVQKHRASHLHYDFRLEMEGVLKSWAVPKGPSYDPSIRRLAMMTEDHPYDYAAFEGVIPAGNYGAGNVIIWDEGTWTFEGPGDDPLAALREGKMTFTLDGSKLHGEWTLVRTGSRGDARSKGNEWLLLKHRDAWATAEVDVTTAAPLSVVSGKDVEDLDGSREWKSNRKSSRIRTEAEVAGAGNRRKPEKKTASGKRGGSGTSSRKKSTASKRKAPTAKKAKAGGSGRKTQTAATKSSR